MESKSDFSIRTMSPSEVDTIAVEWAAREGWNPGLHDAACFHATDPDGFLVGCLDGEPVACISAVAYDHTFGFIGCYIVRPEYRGNGYGWQLWCAAMAYLGTRNIGLDGVADQQENYRKSGFRWAYSNLRYEGRAPAVAGLPPGIVPVSELPFGALLAYDTALFPVPRARFLSGWLALPESYACAAVDAGGLVLGYGVIRRCRSGYKIGPLFADDADTAGKLFQSVCRFVEPDTRIYLDTPEPNRAAVGLAERHGMAKVFGTARMYTGPQPAIDLDKVFGVTSFELG